MKRALALFGIADWLSLAAAPVLAAMALGTAVLGDSHAAAFCSQAGLASPLTGMVAMYLVMALLHLAPWFRLTADSPN